MLTTHDSPSTSTYAAPSSTTAKTTSRRRDRREPATANFIREGTRFYSQGHWWEVTDQITSKDERYYRCKPVCNIESRFFTSGTIEQSIAAANRWAESRSPQASNGRGSGRVTPQGRQWHQTKARQASPVQDCKLLAIGSPKSVKALMNRLYILGFAHVTDWSPLQPKPKSSEYMSILTGHGF